MIVDRAVGIDLGTTNSEVALLDPSEREVIVWADKFGRAPLPSAVAWDPELGALVVGRPARARRGASPPPIESVKRRMGQAITLDVGPRGMTPEQVSAAILGALRGKIREHLASRAPAGIEVRVDRAVITVPAYFDAPQIAATRRAGELAELEVLGILHEPTAAAIHHQWKRQLSGGTFLVYDLGGGTLDVSVIRLEHGEHQVLAIDGDNFLGGDDLDRRFAERLRQMLVLRGASLELDPLGRPDDADRWRLLVHAAQEIKEALSTQPVVSFTKEALLVDRKGEPISVDVEIARSEWDDAVAGLITTTLEACERALEKCRASAGIGIEDVDHVILVGGSTRSPAIVTRVTEALARRTRGKEVWQSDVDTCVAQGAAIHAASIGGLVLDTGLPSDADRGGLVLDTGLPSDAGRGGLGAAEDAGRSVPEAATDTGRGGLGAASDPRRSVPIVAADGARVRLAGPLVSKGDRLRLSVEILRAPATAARIALRVGDNERASASVTEVPSKAPVRLETELDDRAETAAELVFTALGGVPLATLPLTLYRGAMRPRPSALSQPIVVAKDLSIEIKRGGARERRVLVPAGASLPARAEASLATGDRSGTVVLRVLSGRLPIETLSLEVPKDLPVGTPVALTVTVDATHRIEARASVAGRELWATLEALVRVPPTSAAEMEALLAEGEAVLTTLWGRVRDDFARAFEPLGASLREALTTDPDKLAALASTLRTLLEEVRGAEAGGLSPSWERFTGWLDAVRRIAYRDGVALVGLDAAGWQERLSELSARGRAAWDAEDPAAWRRAANEAQALYETALTHGSVLVSPDDPGTLRLRYALLAHEVHALERSLSELVLSSSPDVRRAQELERDAIVSSLRKERDALGALDPAVLPPHDFRRALERARAQLEQLDGAIARLPTLGLVTEPRSRG